MLPPALHTASVGLRQTATQTDATLLVTGTHPVLAPLVRTAILSLGTITTRARIQLLVTILLAARQLLPGRLTLALEIVAAAVATAAVTRTHHPATLMRV